MALNNLKRFFITLCMGVFIFSLYGCDDGGGGGGGDNDGPIVNDPTINLRILEMEAPTTADAGDAISVDYTLYMEWTVNSGAYNDSFDVRFYLSEDASIDSSDTLIGEESFNNVDMYALDDQANTATVNIPAVEAGTYYIGIIVDSGDAIAESNEDDNTISDSIEITEPAALQPNLNIVTLSTSAGATVGDTISISYNIGNNGEAASVTTSVGFYLSTDQTISQTDTLLGSASISAINAGNNTGVLSTNITIPTGLSAGTYYIGCIVDQDDFVNESNESDNISTGSLVKQIDIDRDLPNLRPRALVTPVSVLDAGSMTITLQVENTGTDAAGTFDIDVYLSSDNTITTSDTLLTSTTTTSSLSNGQFVEITMNNVVVDLTSANTRRYIGFIVDDDNAIVESNETDNITDITYNDLVEMIYVLETDSAVLVVNNYYSGTNVGSLLRRPGNITTWNTSNVNVHNYATLYSPGTYYFYITTGTYDFRMYAGAGSANGWDLLDEVFSAGDVVTWTLTTDNRTF